jgi:fucose 4-O-acetylase-like acetyltransferase
MNQNQKYENSKLSVVGTLGYCTSIWVPYRLPWSADVALTAVIFYYAGNITASLDKRLADIGFFWKIVLICSLAVMLAVLSTANGKADMNYNHYGNIILFLSAALSGIYFSYFIAHWLPTLRTISYIGKNTIILIFNSC